MLHRRIYQFFIVYTIGLAFLLILKVVMNLSDYVIPGPLELWTTVLQFSKPYFFHVLNTFTVAVAGQIISIIMAVSVGGAWPSNHLVRFFY